jgi:hypothetical protein
MSHVHTPTHTQPYGTHTITTATTAVASTPLDPRRGRPPTCDSASRFPLPAPTPHTRTPPSHVGPLQEAPADVRQRVFEERFGDSRRAAVGARDRRRAAGRDAFLALLAEAGAGADDGCV